VREIVDAGIVETVVDGVNGLGTARITRFAAPQIGQTQGHAST
jgi:hypothetical protein